MARFTNKVAIITGSSNGIGRAAAIVFAQDGAKVTITGRNAERLNETFKLIIAEGVAVENVNLVVADLTTSSGQDAIINSTLQKFGRLDILVNNAGAAIPDENGGFGLNQDIKTYDDMFALNLRSVVELTKKAKEHLISSKGEIVNVSSIVSGPFAHPTVPFYAMAKAALDSFTRSISIELIAEGVRVNSVNPGIVVTGFQTAMGASKSHSDKMYQFFEQHKECLPCGELGQPQDIAHLIAFLADRRVSKYIIGQTISADGGTSLILGLRAHNVYEMLK